MTPQAAKLLAKFKRQAAGFEPAVRAAWLRGFARLADTLPTETLARLIRTGAIEQMMAEYFTPEQIDRAFAGLRLELRNVIAGSASAFGTELPQAPAIAFDILSPRVIEAVRALDTRVMQGLWDDLAGTVRQHIQAGLEAGINPRRIAGGLRDVLPLAPNQEQAIRNFRRMLQEGDLEALTRALRDKRFDRTIRKAFAGKGLSEAQIERMVAAYRKRMIAFNAETHARTAALDAMKQGQRLAWQQAIDRGDVDAARLRKQWETVGDDRVRPGHVEMNGETVRFDALYSNGEMVPGDSTFNCRCISRFFLAREAV